MRVFGISVLCLGAVGCTTTNADGPPRLASYAAAGLAVESADVSRRTPEPQPVAAGPLAPAVAAAPEPTLAAATPERAPVGVERAVRSLSAAKAAAASDASLHKNRITIKGGYWATTDITDVDGGIINVSWSRYLVSIIALELEAGYFNASGTGIDLWGVPLMVNGRANLPLWLIDFYAGLGIGGIYYDADLVLTKESGWVWGGNAFLGGTVNILDSLALGLEGKYYLTEKASGLGRTLDSFAALITLGFAI